MWQGWVAIFGALAVGAAFGTWLGIRAKRRDRDMLIVRGPEVADFASKHGLQYSRADLCGLGDALHAYNFPPPGSPSPALKELGARCQNVLSGHWGDLPVTGADYWTRALRSNGSNPPQTDTRYFSIVMATLPAALPHILIGKKKGLVRLGHGHIDVRSKDFSRAFQVRTKDTGFAVKLIDASMIQWLLSTEATFTFEIQGRNLLVWCLILPVTRLGELLDSAKSFTDHIPHLVWAEYNTDSRRPPDRCPMGD